VDVLPPTQAIWETNVSNAGQKLIFSTKNVDGEWVYNQLGLTNIWQGYGEAVILW